MKDKSIFISVLTFCRALGLSLVISLAWRPLILHATINELVDSMSLEDLMNIPVASASFFESSAALAPGNAYITDVTDSTEGVFRTTRDMLYLDVPGVIIRQHARHGTLVGMRGVWIDNNAKTMTMLNGLHLNPRNHFGYTTGLSSPLLGDISRIEVIRGAGAIRHGTGAISGSINYIPKNGTDFPGGFARVEFGAQEKAWKTETGYGKAFGPGKDLYLYAGVYDSRGFVDHYTGAGYDRDPNYTLDPATRVHGLRDPGYRVAAYLNWGDIKWNTFYQDMTPTTDSDAYTVAKYFHSAMFGTRPELTIFLSPHETMTTALSMSLTDYGREDMPEAWDMADGGGSEAHLNLETIFRTTRAEGHRLAIGGVLGYKRFNEASQYFQPDYDTNFETAEMNWKEVSLFAEDEWRPSDVLTVIAGLRYDLETHDSDRFSTLQEEIDNVSFRIAGALELAFGTVLKAEYQQGFRTPDAQYYATVADLNAKISAQGLGSRYELNPETLDSMSVSLVNDLPEHQIHAEITGFYNRYHDLLKYGDYKTVLSSEVWDQLTTVNSAGSLYGFINAPGDIRTFGLETAFILGLGDDTQLRASYTYTRTSEEENNVYPYPRHMGKLGIGQYALDRKLFMNAAAVYHQGVSWPGYENTYITNHNRIRVDASVSYDLGKNIKAKLTVQNLFKEDVPPPVNWIPREGGLGYDHRFWYASLEFRF